MGGITRDGFVDSHGQGLSIESELETQPDRLGVDAAALLRTRTSRDEGNDWTREMFLAAAQLVGIPVE